MFFHPEQVVFVDKNMRGRALRMVGREIRIINQIDVLASLPLSLVRLRRVNGVWTQVTGPKPDVQIEIHPAESDGLLDGRSM